MDGVYVGVISGTSMDGIDAVAVDIQGDRLSIIGRHSHTIPSALKAELEHLCLPGDNEIARMGKADRALGEVFGEAINELIDALPLAKDRIIAVGSHGQTIRHEPDVTPAFTLQIADPNTITETTGITTVADFRRRDMAAGGEGAPLAPIIHDAMFRSTDIDRIALNLGGISNLTLLPANGEPATGYDAGPSNRLMDIWAEKHLGQPYDNNGAWARSGHIHTALLQRMLNEPYFSRPAPKSTGRELFNENWLTEQLATATDVPAVDVQATLAELTATTVAAGVNQAFARCEVIVCGGGSRNAYLLERIQQHCPDHSLRLSDDLGLPASDVECAAFAWMARQTLLKQPGNLASVTGAKGPRVLGAIYWA